MMCSLDFELLNSKEPQEKILYAYAGIVIQLIYMLTIGSLFQSSLGKVIWGSYSNYMNIMLIWTLVYIPFYAIHFYEDSTADFAMFTGACTVVKKEECMIF